MDLDKKLIGHINEYYDLTSQTPEFKGHKIIAFQYYNGTKRGKCHKTVMHNAYSNRMVHPFSFFRTANQAEDDEPFMHKMRIIWFTDNQFVAIGVESSDIPMGDDNWEIFSHAALTLGVHCYIVYDKMKKAQGDNFGGINLRSIHSFSHYGLQKVSSEIEEDNIYFAMKAFGNTQFRNSNSAVNFCITKFWPKEEVFDSPEFNFPVRDIWEMNDITVKAGTVKRQLSPADLSPITQQLKKTFSSILSARFNSYKWDMLTWDIIHGYKMEEGIYAGFINRVEGNRYAEVKSGPAFELAIKIRELTWKINTPPFGEMDTSPYCIFRCT